MANKFFGTKLFATALATFALASCQSESSLVEPSNNNRRDVELTVTATKADIQTRTDLALDTDEKKLIKTWDLGDRIHVCEADGAYVGYLRVTGLNEDKTQATFKGIVSLLDNDGTQTLSFSTLGKAADENYSVTGAKMNEADYDFTNQTSTTVEALGDYDLMLTDCAVEVKDGSAKFVNLTLRRQFAFGRFILLYNNEPLVFGENTVVTVDTENEDIQSGATISFPKTVESSRAAALSVKASENDFYVKLVPGSKEGRIKFSVTVNGEKYVGYSAHYLIEKNDFFRSNAGGPMPINVTHEDGRDDEKDLTLIYNANYGKNDTWSDKYTGTDTSHVFTVSDYSKIFDETNNGYDFIGWNTQADGNGTPYAVGAEYTISYDNPNATLYAQWEKSVHEYTIVFEDEGEIIGSESFEGESPKTITVADYAKNVANALPANKTLLGWALKEAPTETVDKLIFDEDHLVRTVVPVYKQYIWTVTWVDEDPAVGQYGNPKKTASYTTSKYLDKTFPEETKNPTKEGWKFLGWEYNGKYVTDMPNQVLLTSDNLNPQIVAKWEKLPDPNTITTNGYKPGTFNK